MALNNYRNNPEYPDRYARNKRWTKILPRAGRPIQSAELTELQSIVLDNLRQGFNTLFKNGSPIKGLRISVTSRATDTVTIAINPGQIYIEGIILDTQFTTLVVPATGIYNIFVTVEERIVTELEDPTLNDPIRGSFVLGTPGASRLVWNTTVNFALESEVVNNAYGIGQVVNGIVLQKDLNPFFEVSKILSRFVFERSGNFCVEGLTSSYVGLSRRSVANTNKYEELQNNLLSARDLQQSILSQAIAAQELVNTLTQQELTASIAAAGESATGPNTVLVAQLSQQLKDAKADFASLSGELVGAQQALQTAQSEVSRSESLVTDQQIISVSPGVAYVEGYRVAINSPTQLFIPQSLPSVSIQAATYTYRGIGASTIRTFTSSTGSGLVENTDGTSTGMLIQINNLEINRNLTKDLGADSVNIKIFMARDGVSATTIPGFVSEAPLTPTQWVSEFVYDYVNDGVTDAETQYTIYDNTTVGNPEITEFVDGTPIGSVQGAEDTLKALLRTYINVFNNNNVLTFEATPAVTNGANVSIIIDTAIYNGLQDPVAATPINDLSTILLSPISTLLVDTNNAALSQPISTSTYQLGFRPVNKVERLVATLAANNVSIVRSQQDRGFDLLPDDTVVRITGVSQPNSNLTFTENISYILRADGRGIEWLVPNSTDINDVSDTGLLAPIGGSTYQVSFEYTEPLIENTDFVLNTSTDTIEFIGRTPTPNRPFTVDYSYFLSKAGVVTVDRNGRVDYLLSAASQAPVPPAAPPNLLSLASFTMNLNDIEINRLECRRQTVEELYDLSERIKQNTQNAAALRLDIEALNNSVAANRNPIAVFTDALVNLEKINEDATTAHIAPAVQSYMLPSTVVEIAVSVEPTGTNATILTNRFNSQDYAIMPYTSVTFFNQSRSTQTTRVPSFPTTINKRARLYVDTPILFFNSGVSNITPCDPIAKAGNAFVSQTDNSPFITDIINNVRNILGSTAQAVMNSFETGRPVTLANTQNNADFLSKAFSDRVCTQLIIELEGEGLPPNTPGFTLFLDEAPHSDYTLINSTPSSIIIGTSNGFDGFTSKADGRVHLRVTLPPELPTGTHTFVIKRSGVGYCKANFYVYNNLLTHLTLGPVNSWKALPIKVNGTTQLPILPQDFFSENITSVGIDPTISADTLDPTITLVDTDAKAFPPKGQVLNQTFVSANEYFLTEVNLKIAAQPTGTDDDIFVILSDAGEDLPRRTIRNVATTDTITTTTLGVGVPGVPTTFSFDIPQLIHRDTRYNIGLESYTPVAAASDYEVYTAVADDFDIVDGSLIGDQLYIDGDMFTSLDGSYYQKASKEDLTMELKRADFDTVTTITVNLGDYATVGEIDYFSVNTRDIVPIGTEIIYKYRTAGSSDPFIPFKPNIVQCLDAAIPGVEIQAELRSNLSTVSPMLLLNGSTVSLYRAQSFGDIESKQITFDEYYTKVYVTIEYIQPGDSIVEVFYSPTRGFAWEGTEWWPLTILPETTIVVNSELQLYRSTFFRDAGADTAQPSDPEGKWYVFTDERKFFRYRIVLNQQTATSSPLIRKIESEVTQ